MQRRIGPQWAASHTTHLRLPAAPHAMYTAAKLVHLIAAIVWMGGMTFMIYALRPAAMAALQPQMRAELMVQVWKRFFAMVLVAIVLLFATGTHMYTVVFKGAKTAMAAGAWPPGVGPVPLGYNIMLVLGMLMFLIFGHIYFAGFRKFKRAVTAADWPVAAKAAGQIQTMVMVNFSLGWLAIIAVALV